MKLIAACARPASAKPVFYAGFLAALGLLALLGACSSGPVARAPTVDWGRSAPAERAAAPTKSRWVAVDWAELPGFADDPLFDAWNAWIKSCER